MNSSRSNNLSLKYQRSTQSGCKDKVIIKFEFEAKTQFRLGKENVFLLCNRGLCGHIVLDQIRISDKATFFRSKVEKGGGWW